MISLLTRKPEYHSSQRLAQALSAKSLAFAIHNPDEEKWLEASIVLPRLGSWKFQETLDRLKAKAQLQRFINSLDSYASSRNKWHSLQILGFNTLPIPLTQIMSREEFSIVNLNFPFVLKEIYSIQGAGVHLIHNSQELEAALGQHKGVDIFLAQEYIKEAHGQDLRIFVTRKGDSFSMLRKSSTGDFRSNIHLGGTPSPTQTSTEEIELAFKALEIFELDYAGIDILRSHQGPLILEVNPCPGFEALETINGPVVAEAIVELTTTVT